jgi:hypothetical protein
VFLLEKKILISLSRHKKLSRNAAGERKK